jgi:hypothetical protein
VGRRTGSPTQAAVTRGIQTAFLGTAIDQITPSFRDKEPFFMQDIKSMSNHYLPHMLEYKYACIGVVEPNQSMFVIT